MIPFGNQAVTLYHHEDISSANGREHTVWTRHALTGCSWRRTARRAIENNTSVRIEETTCRIPAGSVAPVAGDVLIPGAVPDEPENAVEVTKLLERFRASGAFRISSVSDNARPGWPMPHYAARGE